MIVTEGFALLRPWWLMALPALALLFLLTKPAGDALSAWAQAADQTLLDAMAKRGGTSGGPGTRSALIVSLALGIAAMSGPALRQKAPQRLRNLDATIIVMDVSGETARGAILRTAALLAASVLEQSGARQTGLIVYGGDAYLASPLSDDRSGIDSLLFALDGQTVPDPGVRPDRALGLAQTVSDEAHILQSDIVLISGGGGLEDGKARDAARAFHAHGHRVHTLFLAGASPAGDANRLTALSGIAAAGGGEAGTSADPAAVLAALSHEAVAHLGNGAIAGIEWTDFGRFILAAAAIPLLLGFRKMR